MTGTYPPPARRERITLAPRKPPEPLSNVCEYAHGFVKWCEAQVSPVRANPTELSVNHAMLFLQDQFLARFEAAPHAHRTMGSTHHCCIATVYINYAQELRELRWKVNPPLVREPPAPAAPPQFEIAGVPFGIKK